VAAGAREGGLPSSSVHVARSHEEIVADLKETVTEGDFILVKGSRGMHMERIAEGVRHEVAGARRQEGSA
jgi:UDP-N-acetylmuramoyl-tripeptide--D-alanyl-D-alanine ligase